MAERWTYGVTTVPARRGDLLPQTLRSLAAGGFDQPRLFVDGGDNPRSWQEEFHLEVTCREPKLGAYGNWMLALWELWVRTPDATRYAIFQDDLICCRNLRPYLDTTTTDPGVYWNLYTVPENQGLCPRDGPVVQVGRHWVIKGPQRICWFESNGMGFGALGLVFTHEAVYRLLSSEHMADRPRHANAGNHRGDRFIDGAVVSALAKAGYKEVCHNPTLVQHTGVYSQLGNKKRNLTPKTFRGEAFDSMSLIRERAAHAG